MLSMVTTVCACISVAAHPQQVHEVRHPNPVRKIAGAPNALRPREIRARKLMGMMLKPTQQYVGVQETTIYGGAGMTSEQDIEGDTNGFVRITFLSPANVKGRCDDHSAKQLPQLPQSDEYARGGAVAYRVERRRQADVRQPDERRRITHRLTEMRRLPTDLA